MTNAAENVVIIGASHAAAEAISSLRRAGWQGGISLVGEEPVLPYQRPPLSKAYYQGTLGFEKLLLKNEAFYEKSKVDLFLGKRATAIDRERKTITLDSSETLSYSALILALGTRARELPINGAELPQIKVLRTKADVDDIKASLPENGKLLIVGAGYIGLEVAASAVKAGIEVTVLEAQDRVLSRVSGEEISRFFERVHRDAGVDLRLQAQLSEFVSGASGVYAVMQNQDRIPFDCAIVGIGVIPNTELAAQAGLTCDNGIVVDHLTRTNDKSIYAVGDCASQYSVLYGVPMRLESVPNAVGQAKTAALAICGKEQAYTQLPWFWSDQYDIKLQTAGVLTGFDETRVNGEPNDRKFSVSYFRQGQMIAVDAVNSPAEFMQAKKSITASLLA